MAIVITTTSSIDRSYYSDPANAIYPVYVDNIPYEDWSGPGATVTAVRKFFFQFKATGGSVYTWSVVSGSLPRGLTLSADGKLSGTPKREGVYNFRVRCASGSESVEKDLSIQAKRFKAAWLAEARYGAYFSAGPGMYPEGYTNEYLSYETINQWALNFDTNFSPTAWVTQLKALGFNYITFSGFSGSSIRMWPSTALTSQFNASARREFKTNRNYLVELANAAHAQGMKLLVYIGPDTIALDPRWQSTNPAGINPDGTTSYSVIPANFENTDPLMYYQSTNPADTLTYSTNPEYYNGPGLTNPKKLLLRGNKIPGKSGQNTDPAIRGAQIPGSNPPRYYWTEAKSQYPFRNQSIFAELSLMPEIDGIWMDFGGADPLLGGGIQASIADWEKSWVLWKRNHPDLIIGINPGTGALGNLFQYPLIDYVIFEGGTEQRDQEITLAAPVAVTCDKKMAIENTNLLDIQWVRTAADKVPGKWMKSYEDMARSMQNSWDSGGSYNITWMIAPDGVCVPPVYLPMLTRLATLANANNKPSEEPKFDVEGNVVTIFTNARSRIFYTLDGSRPTQASQVYAGPITLNRDTIVRAVSFETGKHVSIYAKEIYKHSVNVPEPGCVSTLSTVTGNIAATEANNYYRGMVFTVKDRPLELYRVGRMGARTSAKRVVIKQLYNNDPALFDWIRSTPDISGDWNYSDVTKVILKAGMTYYVGIQEDSTDQYQSNVVAAMDTPYIRISGYKILTKESDVSPITDDFIGQYVNLVVKPLARSTDIVLGKPVHFRHPVTFAVQPANRLDKWAFNSNDGDEVTYSQPTAPDYQTETFFDLGEVYKFNQSKIEFYNRNVTEIDVYAGLESTQLQRIGGVAEIYVRTMTITFKDVYARYVAIRSLKPTGPDQIGSGAMIRSISVYLV